jgi:predicted phage terminase large subunit-like protein
VCKEKFVDNWHIKYLCDMLQENAELVFKRKPCRYEYIIINIPPGSTKSLICSVMLPVWCWIKDDTLRFITGTFEKTLATDFNVMSRDVLKSHEFTTLWGDKVVFKKDDDGKTSYSNQAGGSRKIASVGGSIVGRHAHIIIIDDPLNPQEIASEPAKKSALDWFDATLSMRKVDKELTPTILIMQRLAEDDPAGHILEKYNDVLHICLPGELTELRNLKPKNLIKNYKNGLFDPARLSKKALQKSRIKLGSRGYSNQILQFPAAAEGTIYKRAWWNFYDEYPTVSPVRRILHSWDTEFGKKASTSGGVFGREYDNGLYLTHIHEKSLEFPELEDEVQNQFNLTGGNAVLIEDKASGQSLLQTLPKKTKLPLVAILPCADKVTRAYACTPFVEAGNVYLPKNAQWTKPFIDMMAGFPDIKYKDVADAFSQLVNWIILNPTYRIGEIQSKKSDPNAIIKSKLIGKKSGRRIHSRRH